MACPEGQAIDLCIILHVYQKVHAFKEIDFATKICLKINSLWPSDAIWRHRSWSTLAQVMACCLSAPSHYLNECWISTYWYGRLTSIRTIEAYYLWWMELEMKAAFFLWWTVLISPGMCPGHIFCLLLGVSSDYAQPITGQVTEVTCPVIGLSLLQARDRKRTLEFTANSLQCVLELKQTQLHQEHGNPIGNRLLP